MPRSQRRRVCCMSLSRQSPVSGTHERHSDAEAAKCATRTGLDCNASPSARRRACCRMCGATAVEVDHIVPLRRRGTNERENLQALCRPCHGDKSLSELPKSLQREPSTWLPAWKIAKRLGVTDGTVRRWPSEAPFRFPAPIGTMFDRRYWTRRLVEEWARRTKRLPR
jgi:5-methylcytosine-specific restriction endonuclease McrA